MEKNTEPEINNQQDKPDKSSRGITNREVKKQHRRGGVLRTPLVLSILVTGAMFCALGIAGRDTVYAGYAQDPVYEPYLSLVFKGAADEIYPWGAKESAGAQEAMQLLAQGKESEGNIGNDSSQNAGSEAEADKEAAVSGADAGQKASDGEAEVGKEAAESEADAGKKASDGEAEAEKEAGESEAEAGKEEAGENGAEGSGMDAAVKPEEQKEGHAEIEEELPDSVVLGEVTPANEYPEEDPGTQTVFAASGTLSEEILNHEAEAAAAGADESIEKPGKQPAVYTIDSGGITDAVCNPVVPAVEYGNVNRGYLFPNSVIPEKDPDPIFAENGVYYPLREVDDSYFADALFIGDSRTQGLYLYSEMKGKTTFIAKESLSVFNIFDKALPLYAPGQADRRVTVLDALREKPYRKVYVSVGVNELGMTAADYFSRFKDLIRIVRQLQPDAVIYVQGIMHVTGSYAQKNSIYNNTNIVERNMALASLANGHDIFYIDMNSAVCDAEGNIPAELAYDGVHLKASSYKLWHQFLRENAIVRSEADWTKPSAEGEETANAAAQQAPELQE